jgi:maltose alpha-D-glucosyltransferase/alpha-amylase
LQPQQEKITPTDEHGMYLEQARMLGRRTAELHRALAAPSDDLAFAPEPIAKADLEAWRRSALTQFETALKAVEMIRENLDETQRVAAETLIARRDEALRMIKTLLPATISAAKTRIHGDYHLGQVLVVQNDFWIVDFEGEPARSLAERRTKHTPLRDVAGMLRSFEYAAWSTMIRYSEGTGDALDKIEPRGLQWCTLAQKALLDCYAATMDGAASWPADPGERDRLLTLLLIEKAAYEVVYEAQNRPNWLRIPILGLNRIFDTIAAGRTPGQGFAALEQA